ncbi:MAG: pyridoxamine kinase [Clostridia bacterium]|nr:pyridoxamine kinase [Clostridia bacterium]
MYRRILTVQDVSCVGQCSLTVALPILSAAGHETAILPSAVLSTHTAGFTGYTFRDLTDDMPAITDHWVKEGITFDAIYTGYLGSTRQIDLVQDMMKRLAGSSFTSIVDPAMADNGKLYPAFDAAYVEEMKKLVFAADISLPNITEACLVTDTPYRERYDEAWIEALLHSMREKGARTVILTGVSFDETTTGVMVMEGEKTRYYRHKKLPRGSHGTGDVYASAFVGAFVKGKSAYDAAAIAADYTVRCIENTVDDPDHWYGVKFEPVLPYYMERLA